MQECGLLWIEPFVICTSGPELGPTTSLKERRGEKLQSRVLYRVCATCESHTELCEL